MSIKSNNHIVFILGEQIETGRVIVFFPPGLWKGDTKMGDAKRISIRLYLFWSIEKVRRRRGDARFAFRALETQLLE